MRKPSLVTDPPLSEDAARRQDPINREYYSTYLGLDKILGAQHPASEPQQVSIILLPEIIGPFEKGGKNGQILPPKIGSFGEDLKSFGSPKSSPKLFIQIHGG